MYAPITTLAEVKAWLKITDNGADAALNALIAAASDTIGRFLGRDNLGEVLSYTESYFNDVQAFMPIRDPKVVLIHYPVISIVSINCAQTLYRPITDPQRVGIDTGYFLMNDQRTLRLSGFGMGPTSPLVVSYTAGYALGSTVPAGLRQAANQMVGEVYKSKDWIGFNSKSLAGETISFDKGSNWGMSPRTLAMLQPFRNRIPVAA